MNHEIVEITRSWLGTPFKANAMIKGQGVDCSRLVIAITQEYYGVEIDENESYSPRITEMIGSKEAVKEGLERHLENIGRNWRKAEPGDVVLFRMNPNWVAKHLGILTYNNHMIHVRIDKWVQEIVIGRHYINKLDSLWRFKSKEEYLNG